MENKEKPITIISAEPVDKEMIEKMIKPKIILLKEKVICVGEVKLGNLNNDLPYYVYSQKDVDNSLENLKEELKEKFDDVEIYKTPLIRAIIEKAFENCMGEKSQGITQEVPK